MKRINKSNKGFTLIELLVVVAIIAILALIVMLAINPVEMTRKTRDSRRLSDLATIRKAIDLATADNKTLPNSGSTWCTVDATEPVNDFCNPGGTGVTGIDISKYLSASPQDPSYDSAGGSMQALTVSGCPSTAGTIDKSAIKYEFKSDGSTYVLRGTLESLDNCPALTGDGHSSDFYETGTDPGLDL